MLITMPNSEFYNIINKENLIVSILNNHHFTIGTSPYYAHQHGLAIDIYQNLSLNNYEVFSPISGKVIKTKALIAPRPKFHEGINADYLILISNSNNQEAVFKILHVKPRVKVGEKIEIGDSLGKTIRNGYFAYWSSPHLHLEIRPIEDAIRARGGKDFILDFKIRQEIAENKSNFYKEKIPIKIKAVYPEFILANFPDNFYHYIDPIFGVKATIDNLTCIVDGGIPIYKNGVALFQNDYKSKIPCEIQLNSHVIGTIIGYRGNMGFVKFDQVKFALNNKEIRGISLFLANFMPLIKLIPLSKNSFSFKVNSTQYLSIL
jgi:hypothetical protein